MILITFKPVDKNRITIVFLDSISDYVKKVKKFLTSDKCELEKQKKSWKKVEDLDFFNFLGCNLVHFGSKRLFIFSSSSSTSTSIKGKINYI
jgi:hypothetical protein